MEMLQSLTEKDLRKLLSAIANDTDASSCYKRRLWAKESCPFKLVRVHNLNLVDFKCNFLKELIFENKGYTFIVGCKTFILNSFLNLVIVITRKKERKGCDSFTIKKNFISTLNLCVKCLT